MRKLADEDADRDFEETKMLNKHEGPECLVRSETKRIQRTRNARKGPRGSGFMGCGVFWKYAFYRYRRCEFFGATIRSGHANALAMADVCV